MIKCKTYLENFEFLQMHIFALLLNKFVFIFIRITKVFKIKLKVYNINFSFYKNKLN
jgi:hypothetical protein